MSILNGFIPLPNWYITRGFTLKLTHRERVLYFTIGVEVFRFPESRETMSKEMTTRGLQAITGINHSHIARILNKFQRMGIISVQKSFIKGLSSIVNIISPDKSGAEIATDNKKLVAEKATEVKKSGAKKATYPRNLNSKKDLKKDDSDSSLKITQEEKIPQESSQEPYLNSSPDTKSFDTSSKISNSNNLVVNLLCPPAAGATSKGEFSALGSVLTSGIMNPPDTNNSCVGSKDMNNTLTLSDKAISTGKAILLKKGFSSSEVQNITDRITASMTDKDIKSKDKYFIACCSKETRKVSSPAGSTVKTTVHNTTAKTIEVKAKAPTAPIEEKQAPPAVEVIEKIKAIAPTELFDVIMSVDSNPSVVKSLKFFSSDVVKKEVLASHYVAEFKKRHPDVKV